MPLSPSQLQQFEDSIKNKVWPDWMLNPSLLKTPESLAKQGYKDFRDSNAVAKGKPNNLVTIPRLKDISSEPELKISVLLLNHNRPYFMASHFKQMDKQGFPPDMFEVIVIDDNSTNPIDDFDIYKIMEGIKAKYDSWDISFYQTHQNITFNIAKAYNVALKRAKYDVCFNNDIDAWQCGKFLEGASRYHTFFKECKTRTAVNPAIVSSKSGGHGILQLDFRLAHDTGAVVHREDLLKIQGHNENLFGWGGCEPDFVCRVGLSGVGNGWSGDLLMATSLEGFTWKISWPPPNLSNLPRLDKRWEPNRENPKIVQGCRHERIYAPNNPDTWGELDTLERIF